MTLCDGGYPLVNIQKAIEHGPVEIVDFPINSMVDLSIAKCGCSPEGISIVYPYIIHILSIDYPQVIHILYMFSRSFGWLMSGLPTPGLEEGVLTCPRAAALRSYGPFLTCSICLEHHVMHIHVYIYNIILYYIIL